MISGVLNAYHVPCWRCADMVRAQMLVALRQRVFCSVVRYVSTLRVKCSQVRCVNWLAWACVGGWCSKCRRLAGSLYVWRSVLRYGSCRSCVACYGRASPGRYISLSVTKCCKFTHIKNVHKTCTFLNFDPVGGRHGGIISQKTPTQPLKWSVGT